MATPIENQRTRELPQELIDNTLDIQKIPDLKVTQTGLLDVPEAGGINKKYRWYKVSYKDIPLTIPLFQKPGVNIVYQISETFKRMTKDSCRKELAGLWKTCSIEDGRDETGRTIKADGKILMNSDDFSNFVGISIIGGESTYESIRQQLAKNGIYPSKNTMLIDFVEWWNSISTDKIFIEDKDKKKNS